MPLLILFATFALLQDQDRPAPPQAPRRAVREARGRDEGARPSTRPAEMVAGREPSSRPATAGGGAPAADRAVTTQHEITIAGKPLKYQATAGTMAMKDEAGKPKASIFYIAYALNHAPDFDVSKRPITFVFNGGPGAAAVWLHMGTVGPKRIKLAENGEPPPPPYRLVDNEYTWLADTDLVFIDPVGTGFSRAAPGEKPEQFYGVTEDINSVGDFIRLYISRSGRWSSPKFLAGESYGTTRAAALSDFLHERYGIDLNGICLISTVLNFQVIAAGESNDLPYPMYLPSYAAAAWYHKKLPADLQQKDLPSLLKEVEQWSIGQYVPALAKGAAQSQDERKRTAERLSRYTSLPQDLIERSNLRIDPGLFEQTLLKAERKTIGRMDSRISGFDPQPNSAYPHYDPSMTRYFGPYAGTFNDYVRRELNFDSDTPYEVLSGRVQPWNVAGRAGMTTGYLYVGDNLRSAMMKNPYMKILVCSGYYDLATPYFGTDYTVEQLDLGPDLQKNITRTYYEGGHMMYHSVAASQKLHENFAAFVKSATTSSQEAAPTTPPPGR